MRSGIGAQLDIAANPGAQTFLSAAALEGNVRADGADRGPGVAADRTVRAPAVVSGCALESRAHLDTVTGARLPPTTATSPTQWTGCGWGQPRSGHVRKARRGGSVILRPGLKKPKEPAKRAVFAPPRPRKALTW